jgi:hypothetical protein
MTVRHTADYPLSWLQCPDSADYRFPPLSWTTARREDEADCLAATAGRRSTIASASHAYPLCTPPSPYVALAGFAYCAGPARMCLVQWGLFHGWGHRQFVAPGGVDPICTYLRLFPSPPHLPHATFCRLSGRARARCSSQAHTVDS